MPPLDGSSGTWGIEVWPANRRAYETRVAMASDGIQSTGILLRRSVGRCDCDELPKKHPVEATLWCVTCRTAFKILTEVGRCCFLLMCTVDLRNGLDAVCNQSVHTPDV